MSERRQWTRWAVLCAYLGIAVLATWPLGLRLGTHLPAGMDTLVHYWNDWWIGYALRSGQPLYHTSHMFYPNGITLVYHNMSWAHILPWLVLRPLAGGIAAYNGIYLLYLALCGTAAFLLVDELVGDARAAFLGGLIYQLWPSRLSHASHPNYMSTWAIPLLMLFLIRSIRDRRLRNGVIAGLLVLVAGYTCLQFLIAVAIVGGLYLLLHLRLSLQRRAMHALLLAAGISVVGLAPIVAIMLRDWYATPADLIIEGEEISMQTDLLAYVTPPTGHSIFGRHTAPAYDRYYPDRDSRRSFSPYLGMGALAFALLGTWQARRRGALPWAVIALVLVWLALGPILRVNGQFYGAVPMLYGLARRTYIVRLMREPDRFNMFLALPFSLLAGYGIDAVLRWLSPYRRRVSLVVLALAGALFFFEYMVIPFPLQSAQLSEWYARLAAEPDRGAILNIPLNPFKSKPYMFAQTVHNRPILQGHSSRYPDGAFSYLDSHPWLYAIRQYDDLVPPQRDVSRQLAPLAGDGVRYLVVHKGLMDPSRWQGWVRYLAVDPRFEDEDVIVYATAPQAGQDLRLAPELIPGLGLLRAEVSSTCLSQGLPLEVSVAWATTAALDRDLSVRLVVRSEEGREVLSAVYPVFPDWPTSGWPAQTVAWGNYVLDTRTAPVPGTYSVSLTLLDAETRLAVGQPYSLRQVTLQDSPCTTAPLPSGSVPTYALFGDVLQLLGYRLDQDSDQLSLTLYWRSVRSMDVDYKVFVHVADPVTAIPVAQDDAMPVQWRYPTTRWAPGETVTDTILIALQGVPAGTYDLALGVYDPADAVRLPVIDREGIPQADGRLVLPGQEVDVQEARP